MPTSTSVRRIVPGNKRNFGRIHDDFSVPDLTQIQTRSYERFLQADLAALRQLFPGSPAIAAISTDISFADSSRIDARSAEMLKQTIDAASALACPLVKILDRKVRGGHSLSEAAAAYAAWLLPLADYAADRGVTILIENALAFRRAADLWLILESVNHPAVAAGWDVLSAALIGEPHAISIPTLNTRIQYVQVTDAIIAEGAASPCELGGGSLHIAQLMHRLKGIGYAGWVTFKWDRVSYPTLAAADAVLGPAIQKLREWTTPPAPPKPKEKPVPGAKPKPATPTEPASVAAK